MKYYDVFEELIGKYLRNTILYIYNSEKKNHQYKPFRHSLEGDTEKKLGSLMRNYIFLYAYSEPEVVEAYKYNRLDDLEIAATRALDLRLPERRGPQNGLYSELLLDLLITLESNDVYKLATRAIYRQKTDNQEIKGFDGLHIKIQDNEIQLWLGQAKMGTQRYSISSLKDDLYNKMNIIYASEQLYFVADKEQKTTKQALDFLKKINDISWRYQGQSADIRNEKLNDFFNSNNVKLILPCLLAYSSPKVYSNPKNIDKSIMDELNNMIYEFDSEFRNLVDVDYEIQILFMPIRDLTLLRESMGLL